MPSRFNPAVIITSTLRGTRVVVDHGRNFFEVDHVAYRVEPLNGVPNEGEHSLCDHSNRRAGFINTSPAKWLRLLLSSGESYTKRQFFRAKILTMQFKALIYCRYKKFSNDLQFIGKCHLSVALIARAEILAIVA